MQFYDPYWQPFYKISILSILSILSIINAKLLLIFVKKAVSKYSLG
jgi:hypothetical protein